MTIHFSYQPKHQLKNLATCIWVGKQPVLGVVGAHHAALFTELIVHFGDRFEMEGQHIVTSKDEEATIILSGLKTRPFTTNVSGRYAAIGMMFQPFCYGWLFNGLQSAMVRQQLVQLCDNLLNDTDTYDFAKVEDELMRLFSPMKDNMLMDKFEAFASWATEGRTRLGSFELQLAVTPKTFIQQFKQQHCITPTEYIKLKQVNRALFLLKERNMSLTHVALDCGFYDQAHFTRVFKAIQAAPPEILYELRKR